LSLSSIFLLNIWTISTAWFCFLHTIVQNGLLIIEQCIPNIFFKNSKFNQFFQQYWCRNLLEWYYFHYNRTIELCVINFIKFLWCKFEHNVLPWGSQSKNIIKISFGSRNFGSVSVFFLYIYSKKIIDGFEPCVINFIKFLWCNIILMMS
jgi:hypothetical protein